MTPVTATWLQLLLLLATCVPSVVPAGPAAAAAATVPAGSAAASVVPAGPAAATTAVPKGGPRSYRLPPVPEYAVEEITVDAIVVPASAKQRSGSVPPWTPADTETAPKLGPRPGIAFDANTITAIQTTLNVSESSAGTIQNTSEDVAGGITLSSRSNSCKSCNFRIGYTVPNTTPGAKLKLALSARSYQAAAKELQEAATRQRAESIHKAALKAVADGELGGRKYSTPVATILLEHYLKNSGTPQEVNVTAMISPPGAGGSIIAQRCYIEDINAMREAAEKLVPNDTTVFITSVDMVPHSTNPTLKPPASCAPPSNRDYFEPGTNNWWLGVGGYYTWIRAKVTRLGDKFSADVEYYLWDLYTWDPVLTYGIPFVSPADMAQLQKWGLAHDYELSGMASLPNQTWVKGQRLPQV